MKTPGRIILLLEVDREFADYSVQLKPDEAQQLISLSSSKGDDRVLKLLGLIDQAIPRSDRGDRHPATGRVHHTYRFGREVGKRMVTLELIRTNFKRNHDFTNLLAAIGRHASKSDALVRTIDRDHELSVNFLWL